MIIFTIKKFLPFLFQLTSKLDNHHPLFTGNAIRGPQEAYLHLGTSHGLFMLLLLLGIPSVTRALASRYAFPKTQLRLITGFSNSLLPQTSTTHTTGTLPLVSEVQCAFHYHEVSEISFSNYCELTENRTHGFPIYNLSARHARHPGTLLANST